MIRSVIKPPDRPSPKNEKSVPLYGFDRARRLLDFDKNLKFLKNF